MCSKEGIRIDSKGYSKMNMLFNSAALDATHLVRVIEDGKVSFAFLTTCQLLLIHYFMNIINNKE